MWSFQRAKRLFTSPFFNLLHKAHRCHRRHFDPNTIQVSALLNIKKGGCSENCSYCSQSARHKSGVRAEPLLDVDSVRKAAKHAQQMGATRFCMGAAGRGPLDAELSCICDMIRAVKELNLEACVTLGMLRQEQAYLLKEAGLDYYNHNIDTSPEYYDKVVTTRTFQDRIRTIEYLSHAGIKVCCGGILGLGESNEDRVSMILALSHLPTPPASVPINRLIPIKGTPLEQASPVDSWDFVRTIALCRLLLPTSHIRLAAGREQMSEELQALCFFAGANSIFRGSELLTAPNSSPVKDDLLFQKLNLSKASP